MPREAVGFSRRSSHIDPRGDGPANPMRWRPSTYMPRRASRITLEITGVRVERLQEISEEDAIAEGAPWMESDDGRCGWHAGHPIPPHSTYSYRNYFRHLWDRINTKPGIRWEDSPWVWVIAFRRLEATT